jgi:bifunctional non-homologous end joining protein LigD
MTDQLSLELEAGLPHLPARLRPMLPRPLAAPFDSAEHVFEPSWGGRRTLAFLEPAFDQDEQGKFVTAEGTPSVRLIDAGGRDLAGRVPELGALALRIEARSAVLDGELVVVDGTGRPDGAALDARLDGRPGHDVAFLAFDVLFLDGRPLLGQPLTRRRETLRRILRPGAEVVAVPAIVGEGRALHEAAIAQGLAGTMARVRTSPYLAGVRSRLWRFVAAGTTGAGTGSSSLRPESTTTSEADGPAAASPGAAEAQTLGLEEAAGTTSAGTTSAGTTSAVIAVFRRLPLELDGFDRGS